MIFKSTSSLSMIFMAIPTKIYPNIASASLKNTPPLTHIEASEPLANLVNAIRGNLEFEFRSRLVTSAASTAKNPVLKNAPYCRRR